MGIKRKAPKIKGTTRVSFGDRQLIKRLWIADKNSKQAKQTRSREINRGDKERLSRAPHRKAGEAFHKLSKNARTGAVAFEYKDDDDRAAVRAMCDTGWDALIARHHRLTAFQQWCDALARDLPSTERKTRAFLRVVKTSAGAPPDADVPLLTGKKHKRSINFRAREQRRTALLKAVRKTTLGKRPRATATAISPPHKRRKSSSLSSSSSSSTDADEQQRVDAFLSARNACEPVPRTDFEVDPSVWYYCHTCGDPVKSVAMVTVPNGSMDVLFFHRECDARRRAADRQAVERASLLTAEPFQQ